MKLRTIGALLFLVAAAQAYVVLRSSSPPYPELRYAYTTPNCTLRYSIWSGKPNPACSLRVKEAHQAWQDEQRSNLHYRYNGETPINTVSADSVNVFSFTNNGGNNVLATCYFWYWVPSGNLSQFDVNVNTYYSWCYTGNPSGSQYDFQGVMAHELGHSQGLADLYDTLTPGLADREKTMYGISFFGETKKRTLEQDDKDGVAYLFPANANEMVWMKSAQTHDGSPLPVGSNCWESPDVRFRPDPPVTGQPCTALVTVRNMRPKHLYGRPVLLVQNPDVLPVPWNGTRFGDSLPGALLLAGNIDPDSNGTSNYANPMGDGETTHAFVWTPGLNRFGQPYHTGLAFLETGTDSLPRFYAGFWGTNNEAHRSCFTGRAGAGTAETLYVEGGNVLSDTITRHLTVDSTGLPVGWHAAIVPWSDTVRTLYRADTFMPFKVVVTPSPAALPGDSGIVRIPCVAYSRDGMMIWRKDGGITWKVKVGALDVGVSRLIRPSGTVDSGSSLTPACSVRNYGATSAGYRVRLKIGGFYNDTARVTGHAAGTLKYVTFPVWTAIQLGTFSVTCSTELSGDATPGNDRRTGSVTVRRPPMVDAACECVVAPVGPVTLGAPVTPSCSVANLGASTASFPVRLRIGTFYDNSVTVSSQPPGTRRRVTFPTWTPADTGSFAVTAFTNLTGDLDHGNDTASAQCRVSVLVTPGWLALAQVPAGAKERRVKDGGALVYKPDSTGDYIYAFKGNNRCEFYRYSLAANTWNSRESIPAIGRAGRKKAVKKGAALAAVPIVCLDRPDADRLYTWAVKGNNSLEFWRYDPRLSGTPTYPWQQFADVPAGAAALKYGSGMVRVVTGGSAFVYLLKGSGTQEFYRHSHLTDVWERMADAPLGGSGKAFKSGSCIAWDGANTIYCLKGTYGEFFAYDIAANSWRNLTSLPVTGSAGRKKVKDGAGLSFAETLPDDFVYALKGGNTLEFWLYSVRDGYWTEKENMPLGGGRRVKGGGALTSDGSTLFALKGNNTLEFYRYTPASGQVARWSGGQVSGAMGNPTLQAASFRLEVSPNPFSGIATISYSLSRAGPVSLQLYDVTGKLVRTLADGVKAEGRHSISVRQRSPIVPSASGVYLLRLETGDSQSGTSVLTRKIVIE